ncbi:ABC transporter substrate-binding protein [Yoonia sediminilitoris]|uniref:Peptide/nickel transport system substrate-binding protein n=1 Tax=Yoonia sediminilitoris TaxID=1286148 RepID=A0A2T6KRH6_9RHOB|nr:ABC transporter substrate-binding protein [Yoonia sediminilitoris]PUB19147.1 peptide/nickel transport system substrate-binding protein [Yoonia sediminilitoris]RCW99315.1 peptide/nickel transport system substrate-binding protein [Yoonia sediminilitoris]
MKRRDFLKNTTTLFGATLFSGAAPMIASAQTTPVTGGTLIWGHSETTQNLDMHQTGTASTGRVLQNVHNSIVTVDKDLNVIPMLAESFAQSEDGLVYTFNLRPGVMFHNGAEMTSADVKYSFERCANPDTGAVNFEVFNAVESIETPDPLTVIVTLNTVNAPFLSRLAENGAGVVMPEGSGDTQGEMPIGAGPFKFVRREFGNEVELERFDDYWDGPAYLDKVIAREIPEPTVRLTGLRTGELHMINDIPADRMAEIESAGELQVVKWFPLNWDFVNLNHTFEPFQDARVRRAFDMIIDKEVLLEGALWGQGAVTASPSYPTSASYNSDLTQRSQDIAGARALLDEAGYPEGSLDIVFKATTNYPYHIESAQILVEWFRMAGVNLTIEQLTWADWLSQCWVDKDYQMTMMNFFTLWEPDFLYYSLFNSTGAFNYRGINDPEIDALTEQARITVDPVARADIYKAVQQRVFDEAHDIILWFRNGTIGAQPDVGGLDTIVHPNGSNLNFHKVWLNA